MRDTADSPPDPARQRRDPGSAPVPDVGALARGAPVVGADLRVAEAHARFSDAPELSSLIVTTGHDSALLTRRSLFELLGRSHGWALHHRRAIGDCLDRDGLRLPGSTALSSAAEVLLDRPLASRYDDVLVTDRDQLCVLSVAELLEELAARHGRDLDATVGALADQERLNAALHDALAGRERTEQLLRTVLDHAPLVLFVLDEEGRFVLSEGAGLGDLGLRPGEVVGMRAAELYADQPAVLDQLDRAAAGHAVSGRTTVGERTYATTYVPTHRGDAAVLGVAVDVTAQEVLEARLDFLQHHDAETGMWNLTGLERELARRGSGARGLIVVALDGLRSAVDAQGLDAARALVDEAVSRIRRCLDDDDLLARIGPDEVAIVTDADSTALQGERLLAALAPPVRHGTHGLRIEAAIGTAAGDTALHDLLRRAGMAASAAREQPTRRHLPDSASMAQSFVVVGSTTRQVRAALDDHRVVVHYQPLVDLSSREVVGAEALARIVDEDGGVLPPAPFIEAAERSAMITEIDRRVLRAATAAAARWEAELERVAPAVAVNLSGRSLADPVVVSWVREALADSGLAPGRLELEVTETFAMEHLDQSRPVLDALRDLGVGIALDDFGTGYSSLSYLDRLPADTVKIDRSFVAGVTDGGGAPVVAAMLRLAQTLGLATVAEGIEDAEQAATLTRLGATRGQGYLWSPPVAEHDFLALVREPSRAGLAAQR